MSIHPFVRTLAVGAAAMAVAAPAMAADSLAQRFDRISFGITKQAVQALMEIQPASVSESTTFGITKIRMKWVDGPRSPGYVVILIGGRVVETQSCDPASEC